MQVSWKRAVVTGGAGFLGSHLCETLLARGSHVECLDNLSTGSVANVAQLAANPNFRFTRCDVTEGIEVGDPVDLVLHFASPASPADYLRLPIETMRAGSLGTMNALELAKAKRARFVLASTSETYGDPLVHPQPESYWGNVNPVGPRSVYDEAKRFAEALVTAYRGAHGLDAKIVRIFNAYGPRMRPYDGRAAPTFIRQAIAGMPLTVSGSGTQTRSMCYVDDLIDGILRVAASRQQTPVNVGSTEEVSILELARLVVQLTDSRSAVVFGAPKEDDPQRRLPDTRLIESTLGWQAHVPLRDGLARTIAWFQTRLAA